MSISSVNIVSNCPNCAAENPLTNKFCGDCGSRLPDACPSCGNEIPSDNKFCGNCGFDVRKADQLPAANISASEKSQPPAREAVPASEGTAERRHLTVMFCDLADSTELSGQLDPEDLRVVIGAYQTAAAAQI